MGNTVGSLKVPILLRARKKLVLPLTERQKEILIGCVLGDAHIKPKGQIWIEQSLKQSEYVNWKYRELKSLAYPALPKVLVRIDRRQNKQYSSVYFVLRQYFRPWRSIFYPQGIKIFPPGLVLSPLILAVWHMDDGCWTGKKYVISTENFDEGSRLEIQNTLLQQFSIETVIGKNRKIVIRKRSHNIFTNLICPYMVSSMKYKLQTP